MNAADIRRTIDYARRNGLVAAAAAARERLADNRVSWSYEKPTAAELARQREETEVLMREGRAPRISVVVPCHHTPPDLLRAMQASVEEQSYGNYELILSEGSGGISENTNAGILRATGEYIALLDHDDLLAPDALYHMAMAVIRAREAGIRPLLVYSDEDKLEEEICEDGAGVIAAQRYFAPNRKPDFNYDYLLSNNYICHFTMVEATAMKRLKLRPEYDGAQDHDLFLRLVGVAEREAEQARVRSGEVSGMVSAQSADARFLHVPRVLYHWRACAGSTAQSGVNKSYAHDAGRRAVASHLREKGIHAAVEELPHRGFFRVHYFDDIFTARPDIGAVGGKLVDARGRMVGGLYTEEEEILFDGLQRGFSGGFTHRAACQQDTAAADLANLRIRPELLSGMSETLRPWLFAEPTDFSDRQVRVRRSVLVCAEIRKRGYRILWDPLRERRI